MTEVLTYARYYGPDSDREAGREYYCGGCRRKLGGAYSSVSAFAEYPDSLLEQNEARYGLRSYGNGHDREHLFMMFCPWCGVAFDDEWWVRPVVQNQRAIDHYRDPGTHAGDSHCFEGFAPNGHTLSSSDHSLCWCDPVVVPDVMGCEIRHRDVPYPAGDDPDEEAEGPRQAMACLSCGLAGETPEEHYPQVSGLWDRPCPECGEMSVWVTEPTT